ncbi:MAG: lipopolysaccharide biosynthesis protein [Verrucomicrobiota bacterium]
MAGTTETGQAEISHLDQRNRRNRSIRDAVSTSLFSKASTAILQFASLPIAARILGREEFGIYATVSTAIFAVAMLQLGVGPALAKGISEAFSKGDQSREASYYRNGAILLVALIFAGLSVVMLLLEFVPIAVLFGETYAPWEAEMKSALTCGALLMAGQLIVAHTDRVREGYMEAASVNFSSAIGSLIGAGAVAIGVFYFPSVPFLLAATYLPQILARLANTGLLLRKRPYLISRAGRLNRFMMRDLVRDGLSFSATSFLVFAVEFGLCALLVGRWLGPADVAVFHVLMALNTAFTGLLNMVGTPIWAAIIDAKDRVDIEWTRETIRRYRLYMIAIAGSAGVGLVTLGPLLLPIWYGGEFIADRLVFTTFALFLFVAGWRRIHRTLAIGFGQISSTVAPITGGLALGVILAIVGLTALGLPGVFLGLATGAFLLPGLILPRLIRQSIITLEDLESESQSVETRIVPKSRKPQTAGSA